MILNDGRCLPALYKDGILTVDKNYDYSKYVLPKFLTTNDGKSLPVVWRDGCL